MFVNCLSPCSPQAVLPVLSLHALGQRVPSRILCPPGGAAWEADVPARRERVGHRQQHGHRSQHLLSDCGGLQLHARLTDRQLAGSAAG